MARRKLNHEGTIVLDCAGLSGLIGDEKSVVALVAEARARGMEVMYCAMTLIEAVHARTDRACLNWLLPALRSEAVTDENARAAAALLADTGLHGHKYAIDAAVAEAALRQRRPVVMLTSDIDDMAKLCGDRVRLIAV